MPSNTIRPTQAPEPAPFAYTVAAAGGFAPEAVFVSWDGTGAAGDFQPCVSYYNADGVLLDRAFPDSGPVKAGDTAEVGYRPFKRGGAAATSGGDYVFVTEQISAGGDWNFATIPQDARHLVFILWFTSTGVAPVVQFNGDGGAHYSTLSTDTFYFNGAITQPTTAAQLSTTSIPLLALIEQYPNRAIVTVPYYRGGPTNGFRDRGLTADLWARDDSNVSGRHILRHMETVGWWDPHPGAACPAITAVTFFLGGGSGRAALYKVL